MRKVLYLQIISRDTAKSLLMNRYFQPEICSNGHESERYTKTKACCECNRERGLANARKTIDSRYDLELQEWLSLGVEKKYLHIMSKRDAESVGSIFFMSYRPCKNGHWSERRTASSMCVECEIAARKTEQSKKYQKDYAASNPQKVLSYCAKYRNANRQRRNANNARWAEENREAVRATSKNIGHKRRCKKSSGVTGKELKAWQDRQKKVCYWCSRSCKKAFHIDHYVPLSKGGEHKLENLVIACPKCNLTKSAKDPFEFAKSMGRLF